MKCKKHDVGMEVSPSGHPYCPECEAVEEDRAINLCETCSHGCMGGCEAADVEFGEGVGGDNIIKCDEYQACKEGDPYESGY